MSSQRDPDTFGELFVATVTRFVEFTFHTLDPAFVEKALHGDPIDVAAHKLVGQMCREVRGSTGSDAELMWSDVGAVMDRVAKLHLGVRWPDVPIELPASPDAPAVGATKPMGSGGSNESN